MQSNECETSCDLDLFQESGKLNMRITLIAGDRRVVFNTSFTQQDAQAVGDAFIEHVDGYKVDPVKVQPAGLSSVEMDIVKGPK